MKKIVITLSMIVGVISISAQAYTPMEKKKIKQDDVSITVNEREKIDWTVFKNYLSDKKDSDSVQFSVKVAPQKTDNVKFEKKYSVQGVKKDINELIATLEKMLNQIY